MAPTTTTEEIERLLRGDTGVVPTPLRTPHPTYLALRRGGSALADEWSEEQELARALAHILGGPHGAAADTLELNLTRDWVPVPALRFEQVFVNNRRGLLGLHLRSKGFKISIAPTQMIAANRGFKASRDAALATQGLTWPTFLAGGGQVRAFAADQFLVELRPEFVCHALFRGGSLVPREPFTRDDMDDLVDGMVAWLATNTDSDGRLIYKYWPSRGEESTADNPIRRFMATLALSRAGRALRRDDLDRAAQRNLAYNMARFHRDVDGLAAIVWDDTAKLGAMALAGLAILENPARERWVGELETLTRTVLHLMNADGSFRTFLRPEGRDDNQNFYPGEALLFLACLNRERNDADLLARILKSCAYYRAWHRGRRNPAFVPWHSQAQAVLFAQTGRAELRDFVFEMNDWLLPMQQWDGALSEDLWGRFYDPEHKDYGPPHASATGVYVEGLSAALELAIGAGDRRRQRAYERALWRAASNLRQLQFRGATDAFYVNGRDRVLGGIRTEVYDNEIRVDNVQHGLMGLLAARPLLASGSLREAEVT